MFFYFWYNTCKYIRTFCSYNYTAFLLGLILLRAAKVIAARLGDTDMISMRCNPKDVSAIDADIVGFVFPVYHWTMPAPAVSFVENLDMNPKAYVFVIAMPSFIPASNESSGCEASI